MSIDAENSKSTLVSILNWNGIEDTINLLSKIDRKSNNNIKFAILDNGSDSDPTDILFEKFPDVEVFKSEENLGFTGGHNKLIEIAKSKNFHSVLILNNDCEISIESIEILRQHLFKDNSIAISSPLIYQKDNPQKKLMIGGHIDWSKLTSVWHSTPRTAIPTGFPPLVVGTALLLSCKALKTIGTLDDRYFAYFDDNDLSARAFSAGFDVVVCEESKCFHQYKTLSNHSKLALYLLNRNQWLFWNEHTPEKYKKRIPIKMLANTLQHIAVLKSNTSNQEKIQAIVCGFWDGYKGIFGKPPKTLKAPKVLLILSQIAPYFLSQLIEDPKRAILNKVRSAVYRTPNVK